MKKTKCFSIKLKSIKEYSNQSFLITLWSGQQVFIPKSHVFGNDHEENKSEAHWISEWILNKKQVPIPDRRAGWYNHAIGRIEPCFSTTIEHHTPKKIVFDSQTVIPESLKK
jgi:hypothetical protein